MNLGAILDNPIILSRHHLDHHTYHCHDHCSKIIKAPFFYVAVGSQANIGGAASAPIVAAAFSHFSSVECYWLFWVMPWNLRTYACGLLLHQIFQLSPK
jgi:uncharacterized membrane protein